MVVVGAAVEVVTGGIVVVVLDVVVVGAVVEVDVVVVSTGPVVVVVSTGPVVVVVSTGPVVVVVASVVDVVVVGASVVVVVVGASVVEVVVVSPAVTSIAISTSAGTLHVAATSDVVGGVPSETVEVRTFSMMLIVVPAAPAVTSMVLSGVLKFPAGIGPVVARRIVSAAGKVTLSAVGVPSIRVGPLAANVPWSNVPPCTWYEVARSL